MISARRANSWFTSRIIRQNLGFSFGMVAFLVPTMGLGPGMDPAVLFHEGSTPRRDQETFARKHMEMRDRLASIKLQLDVLDRSHDETAELSAKVVELSQTLRSQWLTADYSTKRRILDIVFLNCRHNDVNLVPTMRKPFDVRVEGRCLKNSRGGQIRTGDFLLPKQAR